MTDEELIEALDNVLSRMIAGDIGTTDISKAALAIITPEIRRRVIAEMREWNTETDIIEPEYQRPTPKMHGIEPGGFRLTRTVKDRAVANFLDAFAKEYEHDRW